MCSAQSDVSELLEEPPIRQIRSELLRYEESTPANLETDYKPVIMPRESNSHELNGNGQFDFGVEHFNFRGQIEEHRQILGILSHKEMIGVD